MLNSESFDSVIASGPTDVAAIIQSWLSPPVPFSRLAEFPRELGIYFLYIKDGGALLYIGAAYALGRHIKIRCGQYLQHGTGGDNFTGKVASLKNITRREAIDFVRHNVEARFLTLPDMSERVIKQRECLSIWAFNPYLNFVLPGSTFAELSWNNQRRYPTDCGFPRL
jgi:hypothetical protein